MANSKTNNYISFLIDNFLPALLVMDDKGRPVHISDAAKKYISIPNDFSELTLQNMLPDTFGETLDSLLEKANGSNDYPVEKGVSHEEKNIMLSVTPYNNGNDKKMFVLKVENLRDSAVELTVSEDNPKTQEALEEALRNLKKSQELLEEKTTKVSTLETDLKDAQQKQEDTAGELKQALEKLDKEGEKQKEADGELEKLQSSFKILEQEKTVIGQSKLTSLLFDKELKFQKFVLGTNDQIGLEAIEAGTAISDVFDSFPGVLWDTNAKKCLEGKQSYEAITSNDSGTNFWVKMGPVSSKETEDSDLVINLMSSSLLKAEYEKKKPLTNLPEKKPELASDNSDKDAPLTKEEILDAIKDVSTKENKEIPQHANGKEVINNTSPGKKEENAKEEPEDAPGKKKEQESLEEISLISKESKEGGLDEFFLDVTEEDGENADKEKKTKPKDFFSIKKIFSSASDEKGNEENNKENDQDNFLENLPIESKDSPSKEDKEKQSPLAKNVDPQKDSPEESPNGKEQKKEPGSAVNQEENISKALKELKDKDLDGFIGVDAHSLEIVFSDQEMPSMFGHKEEDFFGKKIFEHTPSKQADGQESKEFFQLQLKKLKLLGFAKFEWKYQRKDGKAGWMLAHAVEVPGEDSSLVMLGVEEISAKKKGFLPSANEILNGGN